MKQINQIMKQFKTALMWLTHLPLPHQPLPKGKNATDHQDISLSNALWAFPLIGALQGLIVALIIGGGYYLLAIPSFPIIIIGVVVGILISGALHEDGLADCADGFGVIGNDQVKRKKIMRDSHIGAFGVIALLASFMMKIFLIEYIMIEAPFLFLATLMMATATSRAVIPFALKLAPIDDKTSSAYGLNPSWPILALIAVMVILPSLIFIGFISGAVALMGAFIFIPLLAYWAKYAIGGVSGDVCGALAVLSELGFLLCFSITI